MSDFDIRLLRDEPDDERADLILGEIRVGSFRERFRTSVVFWSASRYEEQWVGAVSRLLTTRDRTALLTSLTDLDAREKGPTSAHQNEPTPTLRRWTSMRIDTSGE